MRWTALTWLGLASCLERPDGSDNEASDEDVDQDTAPLVDPDIELPEFLPGAVPWDGEERLSMGIFYEGPATERLEINDIDRFYFIFAQGYAPFDFTYEQRRSTDRMEGAQSDLLTKAGAASWFGGGVIWDEPEDLRAWDELRVSLRSDDATYEDGLQVAIQLPTGDLIVQASDYGFRADGEWHSLSIPLSQFEGSLAEVRGPFLLLDENVADGAELYVDDVYYAKD